MLAAFVAALLVLPMTPPAHGHRHGKHGNPEDIESYIARMEDPARDAWQKPEAVLDALSLKAGQTVCDVGAGPGYFSLRAARRVGSTGRVYAVDVEARMLEVLTARLKRESLRNITPVLALPDDPLLPPGACDVVLVVDTFHHFPDGEAYLRKLGALLAPGGMLVNIDFHKRELPVGPRVDHKVAREDFLKVAERAGLVLHKEHTFLPHQYFLVFRRSAAR